MIPLTHTLIVAALIFVIGITGVFLNRRNVIALLMSIELMLLAVNINFIAFSRELGDLTGASVFSFRADGCSGRGGGWPCHSCLLFSKQRHHQS